MEISRMNTVGNTADRAFEFATQKPASADSGNLSEKRGADVLGIDISNLDEITMTDNKLTSEFLQNMIDKANRQLSGSGREFSYSVHEETGQFLIKVIDRETKEVIREIPPEKNLDAVAKMRNLMGVFMDHKT